MLNAEPKQANTAENKLILLKILIILSILMLPKWRQKLFPTYIHIHIKH